MQLCAMPCWASAISDEVAEIDGEADARRVDQDAGLEAPAAAEGVARADEAHADRHGCYGASFMNTV